MTTTQPQSWPPAGYEEVTDPDYEIRDGDFFLHPSSNVPTKAIAMVGVRAGVAIERRHKIARPLPSPFPPTHEEVTDPDAVIQEGWLERGNGPQVAVPVISLAGKRVSYANVRGIRVARPKPAQDPHAETRARWEGMKPVSPGVREDENGVRWSWDWWPHYEKPIEKNYEPDAVHLDSDFKLFPLETQQQANQRIVAEYRANPEGKRLEWSRKVLPREWIEDDCPEISAKLIADGRADHLRFRIVPAPAQTREELHAEFEQWRATYLATMRRFYVICHPKAGPAFYCGSEVNEPPFADLDKGTTYTFEPREEPKREEPKGNMAVRKAWLESGKQLKLESSRKGEHWHDFYPSEFHSDWEGITWQFRIKPGQLAYKCHVAMMEPVSVIALPTVTSFDEKGGGL